MKTYLNVTQNSGKRFYLEFKDKGKIVMLNMLRFKDKADYTNLKIIAPDIPLTGKQAYDLYMELALPFLNEVESKVLFYGESNHFIIGPEEEKWDSILLVEHQSVSKFMSFAQNREYLLIAGHRTASLEDSRLLPIVENDLPF